jgi:Gluconate 2-dehydrogenase subunit 3
MSDTPQDSSTRWTRRGVLGALAGGALASLLGLVVWRGRGPASTEPGPTPAGEPPERLALEALLDTLLPDGGPPAVGHHASGVLGALWGVAMTNQALRLELRRGAGLLDQAAESRDAATFAELGPPARTEVVTDLARPDHPGHSYYRLIRDQAMRLHYTHPAACRPLGLRHAPQPTGYMDYTQPPDA